jgi:hypothetical protein
MQHSRARRSEARAAHLLSYRCVAEEGHKAAPKAARMSKAGQPAAPSRTEWPADRLRIKGEMAARAAAMCKDGHMVASQQWPRQSYGIFKRAVTWHGRGGFWASRVRICND